MLRKEKSKNGKMHYVYTCDNCGFKFRKNARPNDLQV